MAKPTLQITTLHNCDIKELIDLKNTTTCKYTRLSLTVVTMKYQGFSNAQIAEATGFSNTTICLHIKNWNQRGLPATEERRGSGRPPKLEPFMVDDLLHTVIHKSPVEFEFAAHTWTCELLSIYIYQTFAIQVTGATIWNILKANNLSYKRAKPMPTKAEKTEQEAFKKNPTPSRYTRIFL